MGKDLSVIVELDESVRDERQSLLSNLLMEPCCNHVHRIRIQSYFVQCAVHTLYLYSVIQLVKDIEKLVVPEKTHGTVIF